MSEPYTPTEDDLTQGKIHLGDNYWRELTEDEVRRAIARIKAEAWWEGWLNGALDECCAARTPAECTSNPYERDGEMT